MNLFRNQSLELELQADGSIVAFGLDHKTCNALNKALAQYNDGAGLYRFKQGEEGRFLIRGSAPNLGLGSHVQALVQKNLKN